jgi:hypothetical protein
MSRCGTALRVSGAKTSEVGVSNMDAVGLPVGSGAKGGAGFQRPLAEPLHLTHALRPVASELPRAGEGDRGEGSRQGHRLGRGQRAGVWVTLFWHAVNAMDTRCCSGGTPQWCSGVPRMFGGPEHACASVQGWRLRERWFGSGAAGRAMFAAAHQPRCGNSPCAGHLPSSPRSSWRSRPFDSEGRV